MLVSVVAKSTLIFGLPALSIAEKKRIVIRYSKKAIRIFEIYNAVRKSRGDGILIPRVTKPCILGFFSLTLLSLFLRKPDLL